MSCWKSSALLPIAHPETSKLKQTSKLTCFLFIFLLESGDNSFKISMRKNMISNCFFLSWPSRWVQFHTLNATYPRWKRNPPQGQGAMTITITITETRVDKRTTSLPLNGAMSFETTSQGEAQQKPLVKCTEDLHWDAHYNRHTYHLENEECGHAPVPCTVAPPTWPRYLRALWLRFAWSSWQLICRTYLSR